MQAMPVSVLTVRSKARLAVMAVAVTATVPIETQAVCRIPSVRLVHGRLAVVLLGSNG